MTYCHTSTVMQSTLAQRHIGIRRDVMRGLIAIAVAVGGSIVLNPRGITPATARSLLQRAAIASLRGAVTGTAETTSSTIPRNVSGRQIQAYEGVTESRTVHFSVRDGSHFRITVGWREPRIDAGTTTFVANGGPLTVYDDRSNVVSRVSAYGIDVFDLMGGIPSGVDVAGSTPSLKGMLSALENATGAPVRIIGRARVAGRDADIMLVHGMTGTAHVWVDRAHPFILKWQQPSVPFGMGSGTFTMQMTSIRYGVGPSPSALRFRPPKNALNGGNSICTSSCAPSGRVALAVNTWQSARFPGYIWIPPPASWQGGNDVQVFAHFETFMPRAAGPAIGYGTSGAIQSLSADRWPVLLVSGPYIYIQERIHVRGFPRTLQQGIRHRFGTCTYWISTPKNKPSTLALQVGRVTVSVHTNALTDTDLRDYARGTICP